MRIFTGVSERYQQWEQRRLVRLSRWPVPVRWAVFVALPVLLCCVGVAPAAWVYRLTADASRGAPSPDAAADSYLMALGYGQEEGLVAILDNRHQDQLLAQWHAYRQA